MKRAGNLTKKALFKVRWQFMAPEKRYAYLLARTKKAWNRSELHDSVYNGTDIIGG
jgi:hypothetical protein